MELLPAEIIINILGWDSVDVQDLFNFASTCSRFHNLIQHNESIWKPKYKQMMIKKDLTQTVAGTFQDSNSVFYDEVLYMRSLHLKAKALLEKMSVAWHRKIQFRPDDFAEWDEMVKEKSNRIYYYVTDYLNGIVNSKAVITTPEIVPFSTPGNLTRKHYALRVLRHIHRKFLTGVFRTFATTPEIDTLLEDRAVFVAQWCQPNKLIYTENIHNQLDELTELVKRRLNPNHPLFKTSPEKFILWRRHATKSQEWKVKDALEILKVIDNVLLSYLQFKVIHKSSDLNEMYIDQVLKLKKGSPELIGIVYQAIARRLGVYMEPVSLYDDDQFLLWYREDRSDINTACLKIDFLYNPYIVHERRSLLPVHTHLTVDQLFSKILNQIGEIFHTTYDSPDDNLVGLGFLELKVLLNASNSYDIKQLVLIYQKYGFDNEVFRRIFEFSDRLKPARDRDEPVVQTIRDKEVRNQAIMYGVGMVIRHKVHGYRAVIFNWDGECVATHRWQQRNDIDKLTFKNKQPFYNVLVEDGTHRYVAQEHICLAYAPDGLKLPEDKLGRFFTHFYDTYYVPNAQIDYDFPEDAAVRRYYQNIVRQLPSTTT